MLRKWCKRLVRMVSAPSRKGVAPRPRYRRLGVEWLEDRLTPTVSTWISPLAGYWNDPTNWSSGVVPGAGDTAIFSTAGGDCSVNQVASIGALDIESTYVGTITLANGMKLTASSSMHGGTITGTNNLEVAGGTFDWSGGSFLTQTSPPPTSTTGIIQVDAGATFNINSGAQTLWRPLTNSGTVNVNPSNDIQMGGGTNVNIVNSAGGTINFQGSYGFVITARQTAGTFTNAGTVVKTGSGTATETLPFTNNGTNALLQIQAGTLNFPSDPVQTTGTTSIYAGATLQVSGNFQVNGGTLQGVGTGTATVLGNLTLAGGNFYVGGDNNIGTFSVTNNYTQTGGTLHIDVKTGTPDTYDVLNIGNTASLGGNLTVNTAPGTPQAGSKSIITYNALATGTNFSSFTWAGWTYSVDYTSNPKAYNISSS
jgi:hypothetical protein